jgi:hypothetical protein
MEIDSNTNKMSKTMEIIFISIAIILGFISVMINKGE